MQWVRLTVGASQYATAGVNRVPSLEITRMSRLRFCFMAIAITTVMSGNAMTQTSAAPPTTKAAPAASSPDLSSPSTVIQVERWTQKQWEAATKTWAKDKKKWSNCRTQAKEGKLAGRKSWSFLYKCMTD